jgi:hypothetical protein
MPQDRVDRLGHVQVAHASARDARRARAGTGLVEDDDVGAGAAAARLELHREVPRRREAVDAGADDDITGGGRNGIAHGIGLAFSRRLFKVSRCRHYAERMMNATRARTAGLPMYDPPELHAVVDAWWDGLARAFRDEGIDGVPDRLDRTLPLDALWGSPDLLFTQTCGYPLFGSWAGRMQYVGTPRHATDGCDGPNYCSFIVVPAQLGGAASRRPARRALLGERPDLAFGYNALRALFAPLANDGRFFGSVSVSGGHAGERRPACRRRGRRRGDRLRVLRAAVAMSPARHAPHAHHRAHGERAGASVRHASRRAARRSSRVFVRALRARSPIRTCAARSMLLLDGFDVLPDGFYDCMFEAEARRNAGATSSWTSGRVSTEFPRRRITK